MDDKDRTQMYPSDPSATHMQSRSGQQPTPSTGLSVPGQPMQPFSQAASSLANQEQPTQPFPPGNQPQVRPPGGQLIGPQSRPSQPLLSSYKEDALLPAGQILPPPLPRQRLVRTRRWLRSRSGRVVIPVLTLLIGLTVGLTSVIWYGLSGEGPLIPGVPAAQGNLVVDANQAFVSQLVSNNLLDAGLPGHVQNIRVELEHGAGIIIQGDDVYSVFFVNVTKHFTVNVQPYVQSCILQVRITHADLSGIPVTTFVQTFQSKINQQLAKKPSGMPSGFTYCTVGVRTEPGDMYVTYRAVPIPLPAS